jgi:hypothetical protein
MLINSPNISGSLKVTGNTVITGSLTVLGGINATITGSATTASYVEYSNVANKPALVSGSSQITYSGLTGVPSGIVSGSSQVTYSGISGIPSGIVSGSSQVTYSGLTGVPSGIVSSSAQVGEYGVFATTGSNQFNGSQAVTGSLTVTGQVVAQTLNVQQVTSSIVYSSGSNIFGNSLSNTQQFTGSVSVTGSLTVGGVTNVGTRSGGSIRNLNIYGATNSNAIIKIDGADGNGYGAQIDFVSKQTGGTSNTWTLGTGINGGTNAFELYNGSSTSLSINLSGSVGIGTTIPRGVLDISSGLRTGTLSGLFIGADADTTAGTRTNNTRKIGMIASPHYENASSSVFGIAMDNQVSNNFIYIGGGYSGYNAATAIVFSTGGTTTTETGSERLRINSSGDVFINNSSGVTLNSLTNKLSISSTTYNLFDISRFSDNAFGPNFYLVKSRNGSIGGNTIVANGDNLGNINWVGANGTGFTDAASIRAEVDGTPGATNDMPGRLIFSTSADGASGSTERIRIASGGLVTVTGTGAGQTSEGIFFKRTNNLAQGGYISGNGGALNIVATNEHSSVNGTIYFQRYNGTTVTPSMVIDANGVVLINNTYASPYGVLNTFKTPINSTYVDQIVVQGAGNYPSLRLGTFDQYDGVIATTGNDLRILSGLNVSSENHNIRFYTGFNGAGGAAENNERMRIEYNGFVGIGTSPSYLLHIPQDNNLFLSNLFLTGTANNPRLSSGATGGSMSLEGGGAEEGKIYLQGAGSGGNGYIEFYAGGSLRMTISDNGSIGAPSGTNIFNPSDLRLKRNISPISNGLDKISALNPIKFNWINGFEPSEDGKDMLGFVAQEVYEVIPEAIESFSGNSITINDIEIQNPLRVNEKFIIPVLVKAIQEQQSQIEILKTKIEILEQS